MLMSKVLDFNFKTSALHVRSLKSQLAGPCSSPRHGCPPLSLTPTSSHRTRSSFSSSLCYLTNTSACTATARLTHFK